MLREDKFHFHVEAVNDDEETLTLSGGLVSPALWPSRIWSCTELWSFSGLPAGPLPRAGSARSPGHPVHQKTTDNKHDTKAAISSAKNKTDDKQQKQSSVCAVQLRESSTYVFHVFEII